MTPLRLSALRASPERTLWRCVTSIRRRTAHEEANFAGNCCWSGAVVVRRSRFNGRRRSWGYTLIRRRPSIIEGSTAEHTAGHIGEHTTAATAPTTAATAVIPDTDIRPTPTA